MFVSSLAVVDKSVFNKRLRGSLTPSVPLSQR
jgi:hypothetical protein